MDEQELVRHIRRTYGLGSPNADVSVINLLSLLDIAQGEAYHAGRTLATLAAAGITTGEDGAVRWHGLTGAEIEGIQTAVDAARPLLYTLHNLQSFGGTERAETSRVIDIVAAAAGRGADREAGA